MPGTFRRIKESVPPITSQPGTRVIDMIPPEALHRIKINAAVRLIRMFSCNTRAACRFVELFTVDDENEVRRICDRRGIPRRHRPGGTSHWDNKTHEPHPSYVQRRSD